MPISKRTLERWLCDRCAVKAEFPTPNGRVALEEGWLQLDLTRSIRDDWKNFEKNEQILCPSCVADLAKWFKDAPR